METGVVCVRVISVHTFEYALKCIQNLFGGIFLLVHRLTAPMIYNIVKENKMRRLFHLVGQIILHITQSVICGRIKRDPFPPTLIINVSALPTANI